jgi:predicted MPP superfamily phosphohydrolase
MPSARPGCYHAPAVRIQLLSDLHFEFHRDGGRSFVESLEPAGVDTLVLAGDIAVGDAIPGALELFCTRYAAAKVLYVVGNHEFYVAGRERVLSLVEQAVKQHDNLVWLDASSVEIGGQRFLGTPLWFRREPAADRFKPKVTDFAVIPDFESWVYEENARAVSFLEAELHEGDVVVTHHLPSSGSVAPSFRGHPLNPFFLCDVEALLRARKPALWFHGHTHCSMRYELGPTTVACNPFGYVGFELNKEFVAQLIFEI